MRAGVCLASLIVFLPAAGCGRQEAPTAPRARAVIPADSSTGSGDLAGGVPDLPYRFPLVIGNRWRYGAHFLSVFVPADSSQVSPSVFEARYTIDARLRGWAVFGGRDYVDEERVYLQEGFLPQTNHLLMRQDRTGYYEMSLGRQFYPTARAQDESGAGLPDGSAYEALRAARARLERALDLVAGSPGGGFAGPLKIPVPPELERLSFPVRSGTSWWLPTEPPVRVEVEDFETVSLPAGRFPAWRTRYRIEWLGPKDYIRAWYGPDGFIALAYHQESELPYGRYSMDLTERVEAIDLAGRVEGP